MDARHALFKPTLALAALALWAPAAHAGPTKTIEAGFEAGFVSQAIAPDGTAHLVYGVPDADERIVRVRYCRLPQAAAECDARTDIERSPGLQIGGAAVIVPSQSSVLLLSNEYDPRFGGGATYLRRSTDGGATFGAPLNIGSNPSLGSTGQGVVAGPGDGFSINRPGNYMAKDAAGKSTGAGTGFAAAAPYDQTGNQIGIAAGRPFAVIPHNPDGNGADRFDGVFASAAGDPNDPATWKQVGEPVRVDDVASNGTVGYLLGGPDRNELRQFDGASFGAPVGIPFRAGQIAVDPTGGVHLTTSGGVVRVSTDGGRTFTEREVSEDATGAAIEASAPKIGNLLWTSGSEEGEPAGVFAANFTPLAEPPAPDSGGGGGGGGGMQPPAGDRTAPALTGKLRAVLGTRAVTLRATSGEDAAGVASGTVRIGRRTHRLKAVSRRLTAGTPFRVRLRVPRAAQRAMRKRKAVARLELRLADAAGNATVHRARAMRRAGR